MPSFCTREAFSTSLVFPITREIRYGEAFWRAANEVGEFSCAAGVLGGNTGALFHPGPGMPVGNAPGVTVGIVHVLCQGRSCCMGQAAAENPPECFSVSTFA